eukprot:TRINITY_DN10435_c0_g1_i1.p1 TRINITY_DN10435_c0_g1~~TRINITY_DN10435_c0_g1_i1.p1  ORF type:complete len:286 (-),score=70.54 TRINITY_DN10435_c0_g1_i1:22-879(-)
MSDVLQALLLLVEDREVAAHVAAWIAEMMRLQGIVPHPDQIPAERDRTTLSLDELVSTQTSPFMGVAPTAAPEQIYAYAPPMVAPAAPRAKYETGGDMQMPLPFTVKVEMSNLPIEWDIVDLGALLRSVGVQRIVKVDTIQAGAFSVHVSHVPALQALIEMNGRIEQGHKIQCWIHPDELRAALHQMDPVLAVPAETAEMKKEAKDDAFFEKLKDEVKKDLEPEALLTKMLEEDAAAVPALHEEHRSAYEALPAASGATQHAVPEKSRGARASGRPRRTPKFQIA